MKSHTDKIQRFVAAVRRQIVLRALLNGGSAILMVLIPLAFVVVLGATFLQNLFLIRLLFVAFAGGLIVAMTLGYVVAPLWRFRRDEAVAGHVENRERKLRNDLTSALQFRRGVPADSGFSHAFIGELLRRTALRVSQLSAPALARDGRLAAHGRVAGMFALLFVGFAAVMPGTFATGFANLLQLRRFASPALASRTRQSETVVGDVQLTLVYPRYTELKSKTILGGSGDVAALKGTIVNFQTRALIDLKSADLVLQSAPSQPTRLTVSGGGQISGSFTVSRQDAYRFRITQADGTLVEETQFRQIEVERDNPPEIEFVKMPERVELNPGETLPLRFVAGDDFGLQKIELVCQVRGREKRSRVLITFKTPLKLYRSRQETLRLADLDVERGDVVLYWLVVSDNDEVSGYKKRTSKTLEIKIHSPKEKHQALIAAQVKLMERMLLLLADRLESPIDQRNLKRYEDAVAMQNVVSKRSMDLQETITLLLGHLQRDQLTRLNVVQEYSAILNRLTRLNKEELGAIKQVILAGGTSRNLSDLSRLYRHNELQIEELEKNIPFIEAMIQNQRKASVLDNVQDLMREQASLMKDLEALRKSKDKKGKERVLRRLLALQRRLSRIMRQMRTPSTILPDERFNRSALKDGKNLQHLSRFNDKLARIRKLLEQGRFDEAMNTATSMQHDLQNMWAQMKRDLKRFQNEKFANIYNRVKKISRNLERLHRQQERVRQQTSKLTEAYTKNLRRLMRKKLAKFLKKQLAKAQRLQQRLSRIPDDKLHFTDRQSLDGIRRQAKHLKELLSQEHLKRALKSAEKTRLSAQKLGAELQAQLKYRSQLRGRTARQRAIRVAKKRLDRAQPLAREIADDLKALLADQKKLLSKGDLNRLKGLADRQSQLSKRLERAYEQLRDLAKNYPVITRETRGLMKGIRESMERSQQRLSQKSPFLAESHQKRALKQLSQLRQGLQKTFQERQNRESGIGPRDRVRVPRPDDYKPPREFTEEVLRAYRERGHTPKQFKQLIKDYYEALLRRKVQ